MLTIKQFTKNSWLTGIALGIYFITSIANAAPATIKVNMDNKLKNNVVFHFVFNKNQLGYQERFNPGISSKYINIADDKIIDTNISFNYYPITGEQHPCAIVDIRSSTPKTFDVFIHSNYTCVVGLYK
jgi:hypothetical protein